MENDKYDNIEWLQHNYLRDMLINMDRRKDSGRSTERFESLWDSLEKYDSGRKMPLFYDEA